MAVFESGIDEFVRRANRAVEDMPEARTPDDFRELRERLAEVFPPPVPRNYSIRDRFINAPGRMIGIRIYRSEPRTKSPGILFFHGGGFVSGSIATHDVYALGIAEASGFPVISINYRLAPENPYPAAVEDAYDALVWIVEHADRLELDADRLAVGGDSAGGTLTAALTLMARDRGGPGIAYVGRARSAVGRRPSALWPAVVAAVGRSSTACETRDRRLGAIRRLRARRPVAP